MKVKTPAKVTGIPEARSAVSPGVTDQGMAQVMLVVSALDSFDMPTVVSSLRMSAKEATVLAARLVAAATEAIQQSASHVNSPSDDGGRP